MRARKTRSPSSLPGSRVQRGQVLADESRCHGGHLEQADNGPLPEQLDIPLELQRREQRLNVIAVAKQGMEARAQARFEAEQIEYARKQAERQARAERTGRKPGGKPPLAERLTDARRRPPISPQRPRSMRTGCARARARPTTPSASPRSKPSSASSSTCRASGSSCCAV